MAPKTSYLRNAVFATVAVGLGLIFVAAPKVMWGHGDPFWESVANAGLRITEIGLLGWVALTLQRVGYDAAKLWRINKSGAIIVLAALILCAAKLYHFAVPHFYGSNTDAWTFCFIVLLLAVQLLLRAVLALTSATTK